MNRTTEGFEIRWASLRLGWLGSALCWGSSESEQLAHLSKWQPDNKMMNNGGKPELVIYTVQECRLFVYSGERYTACCFYLMANRTSLFTFLPCIATV